MSDEVTARDRRVSYRMYALAAAQGLKSQLEGQSGAMLAERVDSFARHMVAKEEAYYAEVLAQEREAAKVLPPDAELVARAQQEENSARDRALEEAEGPLVYFLLFPQHPVLWHAFFEEFGKEPDKAARWKTVRCREAMEFIDGWKRGQRLNAGEKSRERSLLKVHKILSQAFPAAQ